MIWVQFLISAVVIVIAGTVLTRAGDELSDRLNLGRVWIGVLLLGLVTSLPEAVGSLVAVIRFQAIDLAVGNVVGSNNFNPLLIVIADILFRQGCVTDSIPLKRSHVLLGIFAVLMTVALIGEIVMAQVIAVPAVGSFGVGSWLILMLYIFGMRAVSNQSGAEALPILPQDIRLNGQRSLALTLLRLFISAALVVGAAVFLVGAAERIADMTGLGDTFVGTMFLALSTSLPELVVTYSALRLGQMDLAIGNILGSNMMNLFIIFLCDGFVSGESLLAKASTTHILMAGSSIVMMVIMLFGLGARRKPKLLGMGIDSWGLLTVFLSSSVVLYLIR